jgi:putative ABC transport system ATP-binding protein
MSVVKLQHVNKSFRIDDNENIDILKDINIEIKEKEYVSILGSSGSGKSTLMHIIGLLDKPSSGEVIIDEKDVSKLSDEEMSKLRNQYVGFVFQQFNLINKLTVLENVLLPSTYGTQKDSKEIKDKAIELLTNFGIAERATFYPNKISGGQQQRVAIARSLVLNPAILLADEPTGNIATAQADEIMAIFQKLNDEGHTIVMITHEPDIAEHARRIIHVRDGKIVDDSTTHKQKKVRQ